MENINKKNGVTNNESAAAAPRANANASPLLLSSLPPPVFAVSILGFLDREERIPVMAVAEIKHQFRLNNYFCSDHGTLMQTPEAVIANKIDFSYDLVRSKEENRALLSSAK